MSKYANDLASLDEKWTTTTAAGENGGKFPDGLYHAKVSRAAITESKDHSRLFLVWELEGVSPEVEGITHTHFRTIDDKNLGWLKKELQVCGVQLERLSDLEDHLTDLLDVVIEVRVKTTNKDGKDYTNTYFNAKIADDDVPF